jgi:4-hydroxy-3-polyprenylbenzoate decarboxylase
VVFAAYGHVRRDLCKEVPGALKNLQYFENAQLCMPGIVSLRAKPFTSYNQANEEMKVLNDQLKDRVTELKETAFIIVCDDSSFASRTLNNYLWVTYTRCNPSHDIYGINAFTTNKHWGCNGPLVIDARIKPHHAPPVEKDPVIEKKIDRLFEKGGSLYSVRQ